MAYAADEKQAAETIIKKNIENEKKTANNPTEQLPDKELLLFLSEFSDAQGDWVDPEVFNPSYTETTNSGIELEEIENEDHPNNF